MPRWGAGGGRNFEKLLRGLETGDAGVSRNSAPLAPPLKTVEFLKIACLKLILRNSNSARPPACRGVSRNSAAATSGILRNSNSA